MATGIRFAPPCSPDVHLMMTSRQVSCYEAGEGVWGALRGTAELLGGGVVSDAILDCIEGTFVLSFFVTAAGTYVPYVTWWEEPLDGSGSTTFTVVAGLHWSLPSYGCGAAPRSACSGTLTGVSARYPGCVQHTSRLRRPG